MMKKAIWFLLWCLAGQAHAQLTTKELGCGPVFSGASFTIQFNGPTAVLNMKDEVHQLRFSRAWQTTMGEKWNDYVNEELVVSTSWPDEPYVAVSLKNRKNSMAACDVQ